jgi:C-3',4' desaturase CrtD
VTGPRPAKVTLEAWVVYDVVVIGGGMGGLVTAALAQRAGLRTALLEAHTKLGGCAGYFSRGPYTFDAGATALMGLGPGQILGDVIELLGVDFEAVPAPGYRVHLPDRTVDLLPVAREFEQAAAAVLSGNCRQARAQGKFWRLQAAVGGVLFRSASRVPRLPLRNFGDALHDLRILGLHGVLAAATSSLTVVDVLRLLGLDRDRPFRSLIAMLLQDTAQAGPETVPFANAAACIQAYRLGMSRPRGGMRSLVEGIGQRFASLGGELLTDTLVDGVEPNGGLKSVAGFQVQTRRGQTLATRQVALNLPLDLAARLLRRSMEGRLSRAERRSRARWSAFIGYLAIDRAAVPEEAPLFHQVLRDYGQPMHEGNNVLISLSPRDDEGYAPSSVRVATLSTHTDPLAWKDLNKLQHQERKRDYRKRLLAALGQSLPEAPGALLHAEFATPRSFWRYTRRVLGAVGGPPVSRSNANLLAVGSDVLGAGLWLVGDSVFPGQGTMATTVSAIRVVERITGLSWAAMKALPARHSAEATPVPETETLLSASHPSRSVSDDVSWRPFRAGRQS